MPRIKIDLPSFSFETKIPLRITDLNYGNHVGNDTILGILHEARVQYLKKFGLEELKFGDAGLIMSDAAIEFRKEAFYGDTIVASVQAAEFSRASFELYYKLEKEEDGKRVIVAMAKTAMVCYDYDAKKIAAIPEDIKEKMLG
jgi:acyl-CoA thioester hydrolase